VRAPIANLDLTLLLLAPLLDRDRHARAEHAPRQVELVGDVQRVVGAQLAPADRVHDDDVPGDRVRVRVLVVPSFPARYTITQATRSPRAVFGIMRRPRTVEVPARLARW
jgi:hypothetical protein